MTVSADVALDGLEPVARRLASLLGGRDAPEPDLRPVPLPAASPATAAAVDGSHAVLADGRSVLLGAWRAAAAIAGPGRRSTEVPPATLALVTEADAWDALDEALAAEGQPPSPRAGVLAPLAVLESLRALGEVALARRILSHLEDGDVLLLDGPLAWRDPGMPRPVVERLLAEAGARGVHLVGVCKSTSLAVGAEPVLAHVRRRLRREPGLWAVPLPVQPARVLGEAWTARLDPAGRWLFRYDVAPAPGRSAVDVLAALVPFAGTATYPGYPHPLAAAHNAATLPDSEAQDLKEALRARAEQRGLASEAWEAAFADYHDVLEAGA